jgi:hypothetical protein
MDQIFNLLALLEKSPTVSNAEGGFFMGRMFRLNGFSPLFRLGWGGGRAKYWAWDKMIGVLKSTRYDFLCCLFIR